MLKGKRSDWARFDVSSTLSLSLAACRSEYGRSPTHWGVVVTVSFKESQDSLRATDLSREVILPGTCRSGTWRNGLVARSTHGPVCLSGDKNERERGIEKIRRGKTSRQRGRCARRFEVQSEGVGRVPPKSSGESGVRDDPAWRLTTGRELFFSQRTDRSLFLSCVWSHCIAIYWRYFNLAVIDIVSFITAFSLPSARFFTLSCIPFTSTINFKIDFIHSCSTPPPTIFITVFHVKCPFLFRKKYKNVNKRNGGKPEKNFLYQLSIPWVFVRKARFL